MEYKIYGLQVKGTNIIRYIGYTKRDLYERLKSHFYDAKKGFTYKKCEWIKKYNYEIEIILIEGNLTYNEALQREKYWIKQYDNLLNMTEGGEINPMNSIEVKEKHLQIMKNLPQESKIRMIHRGTDNWMTSEAGKKWISEENKKRWKNGSFPTPKTKKVIEYDILYDLYITQNKTLKECANILNTTYRSVVRNLGRLKIKKYNYGSNN